MSWGAGGLHRGAGACSELPAACTGAGRTGEVLTAGRVELCMLDLGDGLGVPGSEAWPGGGLGKVERVIGKGQRAWPVPCGLIYHMVR